MKKILLLLAVIMFSIGSYAQQKMPKKDYMILQDGKMWVMKGGTTTALEADQTLSNGTTVSMSGKVTSKDGTITLLEEGDAIDFDGIVTKTNTRPTKKEKMK